MAHDVAKMVEKVIKKHYSVYADEGMPLKDLIDKIIQFCEIYSGILYKPYQEQFARRIIRSLLLNDGDEITALFARQSGKTETVATTVGGCMIILPLLAKMFPNDTRLQMYADGLWVGIFAPSERQAKITYDRLRKRLNCKSAQAVLTDPDINITFTVSNGQTVTLSNGSFASAISASENSNIEGESFKCILCEECFVKGTKISTPDGYRNIEDIKVNDKVYSYNHKTNRVEIKTVLRSFSQPLYNRKLVTITTDSGRIIKCTDNHKIFLPEKSDYFRADTLQVGDFMLSYSHTTQESECDLYVKSNDTGNNAGRWLYSLPRQKVFKKSSLHSQSIGQTNGVCVGQVPESKASMLFRTKNCSKFGEGYSPLSIYNKMLTRNKNVLRFILSRWEESDKKKYIRPYERRSSGLLVFRRWKLQRNDGNTYSMLHSGGKSATFGLVEGKIWHKFSDSFRQENKQTFFNVSSSRPKQISSVNTSVCSTFNEIQDMYNRCREALYHLWKNGCALSKSFCLPVFQRVSADIPKGLCSELLPCQERIKSIKIEEVPETMVYDLTVEDNHNFFAEGLLVHNCQDISNFKIMKSIHPMGAAYNASIIKIGTSTTFVGNFYEAIQRNKREYQSGKHLKNHFEYDCDVAAKYNENYAAYVEKEKKRLGENSDEFLMSYRLKWILVRGMFVSPTLFEKKNIDTSRSIVNYDITDHTYVAALDQAKHFDGSVLTICEVDFDNPVIRETKVNDLGEEEEFVAFESTAVAWYEYMGDYNDQYYAIMDDLKNYNIIRLVCDATREESQVDRFKANLDYEVVDFKFTPENKSMVYKTLDREIKSTRAKIVGDSDVQETNEFRKCLEQLYGLQKNYKGTRMVVANSSEKVHDDYPDSWAMAVWGCSYPVTRAFATSENENPLFARVSTPFYRSRNRYTSPRR